MKQILIFGAGRSSRILIRYLAENAGHLDWNINVVDYLEKEMKRGEKFSYKCVDVSREPEREEEIKKADLVISMLPARFHPLLAPQRS